jgi:hypothetical protein
MGWAGAASREETPTCRPRPSAPNYRRAPPHPIARGGVSALLPKMSGKRFLWLCSTRERASSPRNAVPFAAATRDGVPQTRAPASRLSRQNRRQTTLKSQSRVRHDTVDNSGDDRYNPLLQILFFGIWAPKIHDLANPAAHRTVSRRYALAQSRSGPQKEIEPATPTAVLFYPTVGLPGT